MQLRSAWACVVVGRSKTGEWGESLKSLIGLVVLPVAASLAYSSPEAAPDPKSVTRGREFVEKTCAGCHPGPQLDAVIGERLDPEERDAFHAFLAIHHVADTARRDDVIAYLQTRVGAPSSGP